MKRVGSALIAYLSLSGFADQSETKNADLSFLYYTYIKKLPMVRCIGIGLRQLSVSIKLKIDFKANLGLKQLISYPK